MRIPLVLARLPNLGRWSPEPLLCSFSLRICLILALAVTTGTLEAGEQAARDVEIEIVPNWGSQPLILNNEHGTDASGAIVSVSRLDFLLSQIALRRLDGSWVESKKRVACILCDQGRRTVMLQQVPGEEFTALRFSIGLDPVSNVPEPVTRVSGHPLNPMASGLHRGWAGGYNFLALEGRYQKRDGTFAGYTYHISRDANLMRVELPLVLEAAGSRTIRLGFDVEKIFRGRTPIDITKAGDSTASPGADQLMAVLKQNVEAAFQVKTFASDRHHDLATLRQPSWRSTGVRQVEWMEWRCNDRSLWPSEQLASGLQASARVAVVLIPAL